MVTVGALILGAATSSVNGAITATAADADRITISAAALAADTSDLADIAPGGSAPLLGFAPPAVPTDDGPEPQFRIAGDLPAGPLGIPGVVLSAYKLAANRMAEESAVCGLPWFLLAGIGRIESGHARNGSVDEFGNSINPINGPVLDGTLSGNEVIRDTDGGAIDGDPNFDRAVGPMQFIPSTWARWGSDGNGDGKADPHNIFDATYSAARYLCSGVTDIMHDDNKVGAVLRYNRSMEYVSNVLGWAAAYATGVMPTDPLPEPRHAPESETPDPSDPAAPPGEDDRDDQPGESAPPSSPPPSSPPREQDCFIVCLPPLPGAPAP